MKKIFLITNDKIWNSYKNFTSNNDLSNISSCLKSEYKNWIKNQDFNNRKFKKNKFELSKKLEYLRLIYLLLHKIKFKLIKDIMRFQSINFKFKLLVIYFLPKLIFKLKFKYL